MLDSFHAPWKYSLISLIFGCWCFPWGPPFTVYSLYVNLAGGKKQTAIGLLQLIEWCSHAPTDVSVTEYKKDLVDLSPNAAAEIENRRTRGQFRDGIGVRITPTKWADAEVEIAFDYPVRHGRFWVDESESFILIIGIDITALSENFAIEMSLTPYSNPKRKRGMNAIPSAASLTLRVTRQLAGRSTS